ncbi:probable sugar transporter [Gimesia maris DSM 8797]|uniref:Niacin/nicotinamide transporter NaiP n=2 Tax=Gimesia maris TaxID=122 RepID=A0ABX5YJK3_9PLAN|nr:probable sugar transporter [Gimesia maris DSM 8797]QEG15891.1 Putative niacin/nicotinamide transporter NaiP [Gimesia maris]QGQ30846.1 MFS transporter [Gimesia maris]
MQNELKEDKWYHGISRYQWLVLTIASLGWVFDVFEGQIFVASMNEAMPSLVPEGTTKGTISEYNAITFSAFLIGGALGGILFGALSDRIGRKKTMSLTILFYSLFTCLSAFSQDWWQFAGFRFLVALGVGGEWAVASTLVAESFPPKARARVGSIFHASSVLGTYLAILAGAFIIGNESIQQYAEDAGYPSLPWRIGFALGVVPSFLIIWIRRSLKEPESWQNAQNAAKSDSSKQMGSILNLFSSPYLKSTCIGIILASIGFATFWGVHIYGKDAFLKTIESEYVAEFKANEPTVTQEEIEVYLDSIKATLKKWEMLGMFLTTTGGGLGLLAFGPLCEWLGRRWAFFLFHIGGLISTYLLFQLFNNSIVIGCFLPVFGFLTLGMHAGYAIYFPELYPTRLRSTGAGTCFNGGRILAAPILLLAGWMQSQKVGFTLAQTATILSLLYIVGAILPFFAKETRGSALME